MVTIRTRKTPIVLTVTTMEYKTFDDAYIFFNRALFGDRLPSCLITLQRGKKYLGYCWHKKFASRAKPGRMIDEIALNPDAFGGRTDKEILSTLAHEMAHVARFLEGQLPKNGYHDKAWAAIMEEIGLMPSDTGQPGGKRTGQNMTHYIIPAGPFDTAADRFLSHGARLKWNSRPEADSETAKKKRASKTKYTCRSCNQNAWAKPGASLMCGKCECYMLPEDPEPEDDEED